MNPFPKREKAADGSTRSLALSFPPWVDPQTGRALLLPLSKRLPHNERYDGSGVTVAFLDIGFYNHPDLIEPTRRIIGTADLTGVKPLIDCDFDRGDATSWHGMMCSVIGAGNGRLSQGYYRSLAPAANAVLVRVGRVGRVREPDIYRGLAWLLNNHRRYRVRVVSVSVGGDRSTPSAQSLVDRLVAQLSAEGLLVVCAAGNRPMPRVVPPASASQALTVGGIDDRNSLNPADWRMYPSSWGPTLDGVDKPDLVAPANWIPSPFLPGSEEALEAAALGRVLDAQDDGLVEALRDILPVLKLDNLILTRSHQQIRAVLRARQNSLKWVHTYYQHVDGTSVAAPIVAAVAAQMLQANPALAPADLKCLLCRTAVPLRDVPAARQGAGVVNPQAAVEACKRDR